MGCIQSQAAEARDTAAHHYGMMGKMVESATKGLEEKEANQVAFRDDDGAVVIPMNRVQGTFVQVPKKYLEKMDVSTQELEDSMAGVTQAMSQYFAAGRQMISQVEGGRENFQNLSNMAAKGTLWSHEKKAGNNLKGIHSLANPAGINEIDALEGPCIRNAKEALADINEKLEMRGSASVLQFEVKSNRKLGMAQMIPTVQKDFLLRVKTAVKMAQAVESLAVVPAKVEPDEEVALLYPGETEE